MRRRRGRWMAIGVGALLVATALVFASQGPASPPAPSTPASGAASSPATAGPVVYYEVVDAEAVRLYARSLDGRSPAHEVAARFDADGPAWTVDPSGSIAVGRTNDPTAGSGLVAIEIASG